MLNMFEAIQAARSLCEGAGAQVLREKRRRVRPVMEITPPAYPIADRTIEISVETDGLRRRVHAARVHGCLVYWE